jgi:hypothetical protein
MAGKVLWHVTMSLDGFIAGPDHEMEWAFEQFDEPSPLADEVMNSPAVPRGEADRRDRRPPRAAATRRRDPLPRRTGRRAD